MLTIPPEQQAHGLSDAYYLCRVYFDRDNFSMLIPNERQRLVDETGEYGRIKVYEAVATPQEIEAMRERSMWDLLCIYVMRLPDGFVMVEGDGWGEILGREATW